LGLARRAMEPLGRRRQDGNTEGVAGEDESLYDFAARRMGRQAARRLIAPVVLGIFAGDARKLSAAAAFPRLVAMERAYGSLFKAMRAGRRRGAPPPGHRTFLEGIQSLPRAVAALPGIEVRCNQRVTAIERRGKAFTVTSSAGDVGADAVVAAADLPAAADLVDGVSAAAAGELRQIESPPMAVVHTAFEAGAAAHIEPAYGFLVARGEGIRMLGCQYETATFRGRGPDGTFLARSLFGGSIDAEAADLGDVQLVDLTLRELRRTAGIDAEPTWTSVARWPHAIPQYAPGHPQRVARIEAALDPIAGFHLAGNALHGVGLSRAIAVGAECGESAARQLLN
ncbi:MAG: protoporphyrinogen oxidase, partial [Holophagales bacterium]|nr:protoporphyrinogen oxidase [Holophagales bacterium]